VFPSDLPGVNPTTLNGMLLYYRLMIKWSGLGDSTELSRVGLSQLFSHVVSSLISYIWIMVHVAFSLVFNISLGAMFARTC
jgi:hypothetical protein